MSKTRPEPTFTLSVQAAQVISQGLGHPIFQRYKPNRVIQALGMYATIAQLYGEGKTVSRSVIRDHFGVNLGNLDKYVQILEELEMIEQLPDPVPKLRTKVLAPLTGTQAKAKKPKIPRATPPEQPKPTLRKK
jgi:hypothetical protein